MAFGGETIHIESLRVSAIVGVHPEERVRRQPLIVSMSVEQSFARAAETDSIGHTVDYSALCESIKTYVERSEFHLLEALIRELAAHLARDFRLDRFSLHIRKPEAIADADAAAVSLTWTRNEDRP